MTQRTALLTLASTLSILLATTDATAVRWTIADKSPQSHTQRVDIVGTSNFFSSTFGAGVGGWFVHPLVKDGFIPSLNDSFHLEVGTTLEYARFTTSLTGGSSCSKTWWRVVPMGGVRWDFHLTQDWTVFGKFKSGYAIGFASSEDCPSTATVGIPGTSSFAYDGGVGAYWKFSKDMYLRMDIGARGVFAGVSLPL